MIRLVVVVEALVVSLSLVQGRNLPENQGCTKYISHDGGSDMHRFLYHTLEYSIPLVPVFGRSWPGKSSTDMARDLLL